MTDRPETARWLSPAEKELAVARIISERVATTELLDKMDMPKTLRGILNPATLTTGFIFLLTNITVQGLGFFTPTIIKTIYPKNTLISQQLHTVPPYAVGTFFTIAIPLLSWKYDNRNALIMLSAPLVIVGYIMFLATDNAQVRYGATFLIASGAFANGALCNAQVSANVISDTARSSAIGINVMMGNLGGLIATWSFLPFDSPDYHIGNGLNLATSTTILFISLLLVLWMVRDNKKREGIDTNAKLHGLNQKQIQDLDWRHPEFRWKP
jgi:predicted MFS family arabinose efflux permease